MRSSLVSRRFLGLAAAGVLGLSTLALPGIALADNEPAAPPIITTPVFPPLLLPTAAPVTSSPSSSAPDEEVLAAAPGAPYLNYADAGDSSLVLNFTDSSVSADAATSYEATTDGGTTWATLTGMSVNGGQTTATLSGLVNGTTYTVAVRGSNSTGHGSASNTTTGTPRPVLAAPTAVVATPGPGSLRVTWDAPAGATGWTVSSVPVGAQSSQDLVLCEAAGTARTCTLAVPAGRAYEVGVRGTDANGSGQAAFMVSGVVPAATTPIAVPTQDDGDLKGPSGAITAATAGQQLVLQGDGYLPGSTVKLTVFSTPVDLGSVVVASDGTFSATVTIPANLANGTHHLVATGVDAQGNARNLVITVTVSGGVATLATTGFDAVPVALGGGLVLLAGGGLLVGARRGKA